MKIMMANVYSTILEETKTELVVIKGNKTFFGKLFFEPVDEKIKDELDVVEVNDNASAKEIIDAAYSLVKKYKQLAKDGKTLRTMKHWAYMHGLVNEYLN